MFPLCCLIALCVSLHLEGDMSFEAGVLLFFLSLSKAQFPPAQISQTAAAGTPARLGRPAARRLFPLSARSLKAFITIAL